MRLSPFLWAVLGFVAAAPAGAVEYPWCANFADGAGTNCGFTSYEQCMLTARGSGGYCAQNTFYNPPNPAVRPRRREHRPRKKQ